MYEILNKEDLRKASIILAALVGFERRPEFSSRLDDELKEEICSLFGPQFRYNLDMVINWAKHLMYQADAQSKIYQDLTTMAEIDSSCHSTRVCFDAASQVSPLSFTELALSCALRYRLEEEELEPEERK